MNLGGFAMTDAGDCLRLAMAFVDEPYGQRLEAAYLLREAVVGAATTSSETAVCATQLQWWRDELDRLVAGEPKHPVSQQFAERIGTDADTMQFANEWIVDTERLLFGPAPEDTASHRIAGYRRYGASLMLALTPETRASCAPVVRDIAVALYALDEHRNEPVFDYETAMTLHATINDSAEQLTDVGVAVLAATSANALRRRYDGLKPGAVRQLRFAWRSARRTRKNGAS
ncbi:MAG: hypothetical protein AAF545_13065 [Pseudomonadota bacterium]